MIANQQPWKTSKKYDDADEEYEDDGFTIMVRENDR